MPGDILSPWGAVATYGVQLLGGLRRAFGGSPPRLITAGQGPSPYRGPLGLNPAGPTAPEAPREPVPSPGPVSPYETRPINEPKRQSGKKARKKTSKQISAEVNRILGDQGIWPYSVMSDKFTTADKIRQSIAMGGLHTAINYRGAVNLPKGMQRPPLPGTGTRSAQRGFVAPELVPLIADPPMPAQPKPAPARRATPPGRITPRSPAMPGGAPVPAQAQPLPTAPETLTQVPTDVDVEAALRRIPATEPVYPGSRPTTPAPSPAGLPRAPGPSTAKPGKTGSGTRVARSTLGSIVLSTAPLLTDAIGRGRSRSASPGQAAPATGRASPAPGRVPTDSLAPLMQPQRTKRDDCECEKPKKKQSQPRPPRSVCFTGTYTETARGLVKKRREQVPC